MLTTPLGLALLAQTCSISLPLSTDTVLSATTQLDNHATSSTTTVPSYFTIPPGIQRRQDPATQEAPPGWFAIPHSTMMAMYVSGSMTPSALTPLTAQAAAVETGSAMQGMESMSDMAMETMSGMTKTNGPSGSAMAAGTSGTGTPSKTNAAVGLAVGMEGWSISAIISVVLSIVVSV
jgi:hypothetical protein